MSKAYVVVTGLGTIGLQPSVKFDCIGSNASLLLDESIVLDLTSTPAAMSLAVRTAAAQRCNAADPSLSLVAADFVLQ